MEHGISSSKRLATKQSGGWRHYRRSVVVGLLDGVRRWTQQTTTSPEMEPIDPIPPGRWTRLRPIADKNAPTTETNCCVDDPHLQCRPFYF
jgi:hypothetical protein